MSLEVSPSLPSEILYKALGASPLLALQLGMCSRLTCRLFLREESEHYWRRQCLLAGYTTTIPPQVPVRLGQPFSWLARFRDHHIAENNWLRRSFTRRTLPSQGQVCLLLDGRCNRALSATLPWQTASQMATTFWDLETGQSLHRLEGTDGNICVARLLSEGYLLATGLRDGRLLLRDLRMSGAQAVMISGHGGEMNALSFVSPTSLLSGSSEGVAKVWDLRTYACQDLLHAGASITSVFSQPDVDGTIAVASTDGVVKILRSSKETRSVKFPCGVNCIESYQGDLVMGLDDGSLYRFHKDAPILIRPADGSAIVSMHGTRRHLTIGAADGSLHYCYGGQEYKWHTIDDFQRGIIWQVFSDTSRIISSSLDHRLIVHDFSSTHYYPTHS